MKMAALILSSCVFKCAAPTLSQTGIAKQVAIAQVGIICVSCAGDAAASAH
jgi:hypothetical protein